MALTAKSAGEIVYDMNKLSMKKKEEYKKSSTEKQKHKTKGLDKFKAKLNVKICQGYLKPR